MRAVSKKSPADPIREPVLIWTRSRSDFPGDQMLIAAPLRRSLIHLPCTEQAPVALSKNTLTRLNAAANEGSVDVICTSPKSAQFAWQSPVLQPLVKRAAHLWTFGAATAGELRGLGLKVRRPRNCASSAALAMWLIRRTPLDQRFIVLRAKEPAFDIAAALKKAKRAALDVVVYESKTTFTSADRRLLGTIAQGARGVAVFASPSAVSGFVKGVGARRPKAPWAKNLVAVCIGETTAAAARKHFSAVVVSPKATVATLAKTAGAALKNLRS